MTVRFFLIGVLLISCWVISSKYNLDFRVPHTVASWIGVDWNRLYGNTGALGRFFYGPVTFLFLYPLHFMGYFVLGFFYFEKLHVKTS